MSVLLSGYVQNGEGGTSRIPRQKDKTAERHHNLYPPSFLFYDMHLSLPSDWPPLPSGCGVA